MKRTPSGQVSIGISWAILFIGIIAGLYFWYSNLLKTGVLILIAGIAGAAVLRLLVNINEFLFNLNKNTVLFQMENSQIIRQISKLLDIGLQDIRLLNFSINEMNRKITSPIITSLNQNNKEVLENIKALEQNFRGVNCDSKDINENLYKLTSFLEEIQKYLHLKK